MTNSSVNSENRRLKLLTRINMREKCSELLSLKDFFSCWGQRRKIVEYFCVVHLS